MGSGLVDESRRGDPWTRVEYGRAEGRGGDMGRQARGTIGSLDVA